ncbi:MAG: hypothetical protein WDZ68_01135, partial [Candidatus Paceibacterota bacterium]
NLLFKDDTLFFAILIVLIATTSFGLGRASINPVAQNTQAAGIIMTESEVVEEKVVTDTEQRLVGSKNSDKYHLPHCPGASRIKDENKVWFSSEDEARSMGYIPAANCEGI